MTLKLKTIVGRQRITKNTTPFEASYVRDVNAQFASIMKNMQKVVDTIDNITPDILIDALQPTFEKSQEYVPVDTGELKKSGFLEKDFSTKHPRVLIGYGRGGFPHYAAHVHERVDIPHEAPTRAKFLSSALQEDAVVIQDRIIAGLKRLVS